MRRFLIVLIALSLAGCGSFGKVFFNNKYAQHAFDKGAPVIDENDGGTQQ